MSEGGDVRVAEGGDAVSHGRREGLFMGIPGMLEGLPGRLAPREVLVIAMLRGNIVGMGGDVVQFGCPLVILVVRSVVKSSRHLELPYAARLIVGLPGEFVGVVRVFESAFLVPAPARAIALLIVLGGSAMSLGR